MEYPPVWDKENPIPGEVITYVDKNVFANFPEGSTVVRISTTGIFNWTAMAKIETTNFDGEAVLYFLKVCQGDGGEGMVRGEFHSMSALHEAVPTFVPKPHAWGTYESKPDIHYFLCDFVDMEYQTPDENELPREVAKLHLNGASPNGKFGFPVTTYQGRLPQDNTECDTWEESFSRGIQHFFEMEEESQGHDDEIAEMRQKIVERVIPRLLRPLETEGRKVVPTLVHGDLWDGNTAVVGRDSKPVIFDACSSYAHHEYELAPWRPKRHELGFTESYVKAYRRFHAASEPKEDFLDRLDLYCLRFNLCSSALYPGQVFWRAEVKKNMQHLIQRVPLGYEEYIALQKPTNGEVALESTNKLDTDEENNPETDNAAASKDTDQDVLSQPGGAHGLREDRSTTLKEADTAPAPSSSSDNENRSPTCENRTDSDSNQGVINSLKAYITGFLGWFLRYSPV